MSDNVRNYRDDREWSDKMMPMAKGIIGRCLVNDASFEEDVHEATDLTILTRGKLKIACRVRTPGYEKYYKDFTIRVSRPSGSKTEWEKFQEGWCDYMFYGHSNKQENDIPVWWFLRLDRVVECMVNRSWDIKWGVHNNTDGTKFLSIEALSFPKDCNPVMYSYLDKK